jgi:hypothetical protein
MICDKSATVKMCRVETWYTDDTRAAFMLRCTFTLEQALTRVPPFALTRLIEWLYSDVDTFEQNNVDSSVAKDIWRYNVKRDVLKTVLNGEGEIKGYTIPGIVDACMEFPRLPKTEIRALVRKLKVRPPKVSESLGLKWEIRYLTVLLTSTTAADMFGNYNNSELDGLWLWLSETADCAVPIPVDDNVARKPLSYFSTKPREDCLLLVHTLIFYAADPNKQKKKDNVSDLSMTLYDFVDGYTAQSVYRHFMEHSD